MTVSVYLGSRPGNDPVHCQNAYKLGRLLAEAGIAVVYGGARVGTMGELARGVLEAGGNIKGVIPTGFKGRKSYADKGMDVWLPGIEKIETPDFPTRITTMENMCDAFIVLPGSCGTLHEFASALEGSVLGRYEKKIAILNTGGYYDPLLELIYNMEREGFTDVKDSGWLVVSATPEELVNKLK